MADAEEAVLPEADPGCSSLPDKWAKERLEKHYLPSSLGSQGSSKVVHGEKHFCGPPESCPPARTAIWRLQKRKKPMATALLLWLPVIKKICRHLLIGLSCVWRKTWAPW